MALFALLLAVPFAAQQAGAPPQRPGGPPPAQQQVRARVHQAEPGTAQWRHERRLSAQSMVQADNQYRWRMARLERMRELYQGQNRADRLAELDRMRDRVRDQYRARLDDCRAVLGDRDPDRLMDRLQDRLQDRDLDRLPDRDRDRLRDPELHRTLDDQPRD
jgi:hypothetical protein